MLSLEKVEEQAPKLVSLVKTAKVSLEKAGVTGQAAVYLVLDHSGSMQGYYANGSVQALATRTLALAVNLDDDGSVPLVFFNSVVDHVTEIHLTDYEDAVQREHVLSAWGLTNYADAMDVVVNHYKVMYGENSNVPALVVFQTDGEPYTADMLGKINAVHAIRAYSELPIFWAFVGFGPARNMMFLKGLDTLSGRRVDNASFFHAADPHRVSDAELLDGITKEFGEWQGKARAEGILR